MIAALTEQQIRRYARQLVLGSVGIRGQRKLATAAVHVAVDSAAAHVAIAYLAAAGVGTVALGGPVDSPIDGAEIAGAPLLAAADIGSHRGDAIAARIAALEPDVEVVAAAPEHGAPLEVDATDDPARALIAGGLAAARAIARICEAPDS
jgi:adenylyltransferase/sulfurtransferase